MPKEFKKRGKRGKKLGGKDNDEDSYIVYARPEDSKRKDAALAGVEYVEKPEAEVAPRLERRQDGASNEGTEASTSAYQPPERFSLWPLLDADTKAYFKQLEEKIVELEELNAFGRGAREDGAAEDEDELDDRVLLLRAALNQLGGKETSIASDPETSVIVERLLYSMDDFARRVLADRLSGEYKELSKDRFASHVVQTILILGGGETVERERRGNVASAPLFSGSSSTSTENGGELPTMTEAIISITRELLADIPSVVASQQGSYILRILLVLLSGRELPFNSHTSTTSASAIARSKKSVKWKAQKAQMRSFLSNGAVGANSTASYQDKGKAPERRIVPPPFTALLDEVMLAIDEALSGGFPRHSKEGSQNLRMKSEDPVATGLVQVLLEIEHDLGRSEEKGSLMDRIMEGLVSEHAANPNMQQPARSDYVESLLRSNIASHVLEVVLQNVSQPVFELMFKMYFAGRINRLAGHPVANFVTARVVQRANKEQVELVVDELASNQETLEGIVENSRTGVLQNLMEQVVKYDTRQSELHKMMLGAFQLKGDEDQIVHLIPCGLSLMTLKLYKRNPSYTDPTKKAEYHTQGALLLQAWLRVPASPVSASLLATPFERLLLFCSDPMASRVIDVFLDESNRAISHKDRRNFLRSLIGHYDALASDRLGSRVADRCWAVADPFLKDKIAASLVPHEYALQNSNFGYYFLRKVNLPLYKRNKDEWKARQGRGEGGTPAELHAQAARKLQEQQQAKAEAEAARQRQEATAAASSALADETEPSKKDKKKRKKDKVDEIDEVFKTVKRGKTASHFSAPVAAAEGASGSVAQYANKDDALGEVFQAIKKARKSTRQA